MPAALSTIQLAAQHLGAGRPEQAKAILQRHLQQRPGDAAASRLMASALSTLGEHARAVHFATQAAAATPRNVEVLTDLAVIQWRAEAPDEAETTLRRALAVEPGNVRAGQALATVMGSVGRFADAVEACQPVIEASHWHPRMAASFAHLLTQLGRAEEAIDALRRGAAADPDNFDIVKELPSRINYDPRAAPEEVYQAHARYGRLLESTWGARGAGPYPPLPRPQPDEAERPLRVGLVSADLHAHPISSFIEALLRHHDRSQFPITCYHTGHVTDTTTQALRSVAAGWRQGSGADHAGLATVIREDRIDILIELGGHTAGNSLPALLMRPAPIQVTYLGYPNTTGLSAVDARIVDSLTDPPPWSDALATERLVRLDPCFLCYTPPTDTPAVEPTPPSQRSGAGGITFGSFNSLLKTNGRVIRLWSRVLDAAPRSRLVLKSRALLREDCRRDLASRLTEAGIGPDRAELRQPVIERDHHLGAYNGIDIALDTVPYAGTTTTCEAMLMGVPTVTLEGRSHAGRVGVSLLSAIGLRELVARDEDEYVRIAAALAAGPGRLAELRRTLRERLMGSPLTDGPVFTARFQTAMRALWRSRCVGTPVSK